MDRKKREENPCTYCKKICIEMKYFTRTLELKGNTNYSNMLRSHSRCLSFVPSFHCDWIYVISNIFCRQYVPCAVLIDYASINYAKSVLNAVTKRWLMKCTLNKQRNGIAFTHKHSSTIQHTERMRHIQTVRDWDAWRLRWQVERFRI